MGFMAILKDKNVLIAAGAGLVVGYMISQWRAKKQMAEMQAKMAASRQPARITRPMPQQMPRMQGMGGMGNFDNLDDLGCGDKPCGPCAAKANANDLTGLTGLAENTEELYFGE